nr:hypothetical protein [Tolivirales sp.]
MNFYKSKMLSAISWGVGALLEEATSTTTTVLSYLTAASVEALFLSPIGKRCVGAAIIGGVGVATWSYYRTFYQRRGVVLQVANSAFHDAQSILPQEGANPDGDLVASGHSGRMCRRVAKRCGSEIRLRMGYPKRTDANRVVAAQRCRAWFEENCPSLRKCDLPVAVARAVAVALTPDYAELDAARALFSPHATDAEHFVTVPHLVPALKGPVGEVLAMFGLTTPSVQHF